MKTVEIKAIIKKIIQNIVNTKDSGKIIFLKKKFSQSLSNSSYLDSNIHLFKKNFPIFRLLSINFFDFLQKIKIAREFKKKKGTGMEENISLAEERFQNLNGSLHKNSAIKGKFWDFVQPYYVQNDMNESSEPIERSHGTMGWTYMFDVPITKEYEMLKNFYESVFLEDINICLDQSLTRPYFQWFCDLDFKSSKKPEFSELFKYCKCIISELKTFFPSFYETDLVPNQAAKSKFYDHQTQEWIGSGEGKGRLRVMMSSSGLKEGKNEREVYTYSVGIHLNSIGRLRVTEMQARLMRSYMINKLSSQFGPRNMNDPLANDWNDVFDANVYKGRGGVRILGSCKVMQCTNCNNKIFFKNLSEKEKDLFSSLDTVTKKLTSCQQCKGRGKYMVAKAYKPIEVFDWDGNPDSSCKWLLEPESIFDALLACSIRTAVEEWKSTWTAPQGYDEQYLRDQAILEQSLKRKKDFPPIQKLIHSNTEAKRSEWYPPNSEEVQLILKNIELFDPIGRKYSNLFPKCLKRYTQTCYYLELNPNDPSSSFCLKCNKNHKSQTFFAVYPEYIEQKSWSNNVETCGKKELKISLDENIRELLFGKTISTSNIKNSYVNSFDLNLDTFSKKPTMAEMISDKFNVEKEKQVIKLSADNLKFQNELQNLISEKAKGYHEGTTRENYKNNARKSLNTNMFGQMNNYQTNKNQTQNKTNTVNQQQSSYQALIQGKKAVKPKDSSFQNITIYKDTSSSTEGNKKRKENHKENNVSATPVWLTTS